MKITTIPLGANCYLVTDEITSEMLVVDPGENAKAIIDIIKDSQAKLKYIVLTHAHFDHICAVDEIKEHFDVPVVIHEADSLSLNDDIYNLCSMVNLPVPKTKADLIVKDKDVLTLGTSKIEVLHTPGHTKGSICLHFDDNLISGDTLFELSVGRADFIGGDFDTLMSSIKNKLYTLNPKTVVYPGHGNSTTIEYEKKYNPYVRG